MCLPCVKQNIGLDEGIITDGSDRTLKCPYCLSDHKARFREDKKNKGQYHLYMCEFEVEDNLWYYHTGDWELFLDDEQEQIESRFQ